MSGSRARRESQVGQFRMPYQAPIYGHPRITAARSAQANAFQSSARAMPIPPFVHVQVQIQQRFIVAEGNVPIANLVNALRYLSAGFSLFPGNRILVLDVRNEQMSEVIRLLALTGAARIG